MWAIYSGREKVGTDDKLDFICEFIFILFIVLFTDRCAGRSGLHNRCEVAQKQRCEGGGTGFRIG